MKDYRAYTFTETGRKKVEAFVSECTAKRKEILDAGKDTADDTTLPTVDDILSDLTSSYIESEGEYLNAWGVTDSYNSAPLCLIYGMDFMEDRTYTISARVTKTVELTAKEAGMLAEYACGVRPTQDIAPILEKFTEGVDSDDMDDKGYIPDCWLQSDLGMENPKVSFQDVDL